MRLLSFLTVLTVTGCGACKSAVTADAAVLHSTHEVQSPSALRVFPINLRERPQVVAAIDGQTVKIFDADLKLLRTLQGLTNPIDVFIDDEGRATILDPGANAIARFDVSGALDPTFGVNGRLTAPELAQAIGFWVVGSKYMPVHLADGSSYALGPSLDDGGIGLGDLEPYGDARGFGQKAGCGFAPPFRSPTWEVEGGKVCRQNGVAPITISRRGVSFVEYAEGPQPIVGDFWALDSTGQLHLFRTGDFEATYALEYQITAIASGGDGQLYTAGKGVIEQRALPLLRYSVNQLN